MASTKVAFLAVAVLLLQASWCAVAHQAGTAAVMTVTSFKRGQDGGGGPTACDGKNHNDEFFFAALSTKWYRGGSRCFRFIRITSSQKTMMMAVVLDKCDSQSGCKDNTIATNKAVWDGLGLDTSIGQVPVTWSDV